MDLRGLLEQHRLVAIVRGRDADAATRSVVALVEAGVPLVEVSLTTVGAEAVIERARAELGPEVALGAGTVCTAVDAMRAAEAGATFVVTPGYGPGVDEATRLGLPALVGALSPTEVIAATGAGATAVKLFPASVGGPAYLKALRDPFPDVSFVPVGGVDAELARGYLAAGAIAVGVGSPLLGDAPHGGDVAALHERAKRFLDAVAA
ncbi:bifunctional 4-hydroxy-2-oxoglutarate aldolase/2-dehydro-3-deoxy-phosphogluconate aldolase [Phytohabitans sp. ZYX-F-186]|uniref:Bifunctional 4-hydroxy-2-oxoglutarate aldolase/2-dehydro-3-deoxy-phosphogluconate aldolase n=1 Tax=Phytohabitans maris TaxID=3071409 RepID=A0ABU0Z844_9ACTN|nr:bifunctional 4-hydroxy-2-oxoglutarate aldolase/2-dehydro-3-deoxy-phosphogluconate aldolase [Phytohabitans sp. ZYX-F-186]MDQ7903225.1 bifunctional 4-hydroxy-2-oxoglutarate aldolase/2-dehydro-3-deoxy-phosphogluconate aldolase [Phytohabitans sp. ZYX-F-186]